MIGTAGLVELSYKGPPFRTRASSSRNPTQQVLSKMNSSLMLSQWGRRLGKTLMKHKVPEGANEGSHRWKIVTGDLVKVVQGPQAGQQGKVLQILRKANRILIENVNVRKRSIKPRMDGTPGKMVSKPCTVHYSNVMLIDPTTGEPTKIARRFLEDGTKVRVSKKTGQIIPKPDPLANRKLRSSLVGPKDTAQEDTFQVSFADYQKYLPFLYPVRSVAAAEMDVGR